MRSDALHCFISHYCPGGTPDTPGNTGEFGLNSGPGLFARASGGVPLLNRAMPKPECQRVAGSEGTYEPSLVSLSAVSRCRVTGTHSREARSCFQLRLASWSRVSATFSIYPVADYRWRARRNARSPPRRQNGYLIFVISCKEVAVIIVYHQVIFITLYSSLFLRLINFTYYYWLLELYLILIEY